MCCHDVTPCAGVWIEITTLPVNCPVSKCHSLCGSVDWNGRSQRIFPRFWQSLPVRECGLKYFQQGAVKQQVAVTPCAGVWIEIFLQNRLRPAICVTPCAGVWIEILPPAAIGLRHLRHSLCGSVDWNTAARNTPPSLWRHSLCGSVDWNSFMASSPYASTSHSLCGSVDWNFKPQEIEGIRPESLPVRECGLKFQTARNWGDKTRVTPCAGVWIEIKKCWEKTNYRWSLPVRECGLKYWPEQAFLTTCLSLPVRECGLKSSASISALITASCHSLCGSVDWNNGIKSSRILYIVTPCAGVWSEI